MSEVDALVHAYLVTVSDELATQFTSKRPSSVPWSGPDLKQLIEFYRKHCKEETPIPEEAVVEEEPAQTNGETKRGKKRKLGEMKEESNGMEKELQELGVMSDKLEEIKGVLVQKKKKKKKKIEAKEESLNQEKQLIQMKENLTEVNTQLDKTEKKKKKKKIDAKVKALKKEKELIEMTEDLAKAKTLLAKTEKMKKKIKKKKIKQKSVASEPPTNGGLTASPDVVEVIQDAENKLAAVESPEQEIADSTAVADEEEPGINDSVAQDQEEDSDIAPGESNGTLEEKKRKSKKSKLKRQNNSFRRVKEEDVEIKKEELANNTFEAKGGADQYGFKANQILKHTKGRSFRHEKTKKKRGTYKGGTINMGVTSIKFDSD